MTQWTDKHYNFNYTLTKSDIENGSIKLDPYFVSKQWNVGGKDTSGALFHVLKTVARFGDKNEIEREVKALYAQVLGVARSFGVDLEVKASEQKGTNLKVWCDTCEGVGHYDNTGLGVLHEYRNMECPCPDCDGKGYNNNGGEDGVVVKTPLPLWYPDDSGEWVDFSGKTCPVHPNVVVDVLLAGERDGTDVFFSYHKEASTWEWNAKRPGNKVVAYKVVK